jgi:DNA-binding Xre family transcriptional regulator
MMQSKVKDLAIAKGITKPAELGYEARISWPTANQVWEGDLSNTRLDTARKIAAALGCKINDLFDFVDERTMPT